MKDELNESTSAPFPAFNRSPCPYFYIETHTVEVWHLFAVSFQRAMFSKYQCGMFFGASQPHCVFPCSSSVYLHFNRSSQLRSLWRYNCPTFVCKIPISHDVNIAEGFLQSARTVPSCLHDLRHKSSPGKTTPGCDTSSNIANLLGFRFHGHSDLD